MMRDGRIRKALNSGNVKNLLNMFRKQSAENWERVNVEDLIEHLKCCDGLVEKYRFVTERYTNAIQGYEINLDRILKYERTEGLRRELIKKTYRIEVFDSLKLVAKFTDEAIKKYYDIVESKKSKFITEFDSLSD